jgi:hypothetical protein
MRVARTPTNWQRIIADGGGVTLKGGRIVGRLAQSRCSVRKSLFEEGWMRGSRRMHDGRPSLPGLTHLRGRSPFGVARVRQPIQLCKKLFELMDARVEFRARCLKQATKVPDGQISSFMSSSTEKNISFLASVETAIEPIPSRAHKRGVAHRHERGARDAMDASNVARRATNRGR